MVSPPIIIPDALRNPDYRFILVREREKRAFEPDWQNTSNYQYDNQRLKAHLSVGGNYGIIGGHGGLIIIDADFPQVAEAVKENLPETLTVRTGRDGGGTHYYYDCPDLEVNIILKDETTTGGNNLGTVMAKAKYVVGPNCIHPTGRPYRVVKDAAIAAVKAEQIRVALAEYLQTQTDQTAQESKEEAKRRGADLDTLRITDVVNTLGLKQLAGGAYQGPHPVHGSETGVNFKIDPDKNLWVCYRHMSGGSPIQWIAVQEGIISCDESKSGSLRGSKFMDVLKVAQERYGLKVEKKTPRRRRRQDDEEKPDPGEVARALMSETVFKTLNDTEEVFWYNGGTYKPNGEIKVKELVEKSLADDASTHLANEVIFHVRARTYIPRSAFTPAADDVWLKNGIFNLFEGTIQDFTPDKMSLDGLGIEYDPGAECPAILQFLSEVLYEEDIQVMQELLGYLLLKDYRYQKAFMFVGEGANGKSTLIALMKEFLGAGNVACISLQELGINKFAVASLYQKMANLYPDLPSESMKDTGRFKLLTGGDAISAEHKYRPMFQFVNYAKMIFSANTLPKVHDQTDAFFRRWIIFTFPNKFYGDKANPRIGEKLTTPEELSGLFNWAHAGLKRLVARGQFSHSRSVDEIREAYERLSSPLHAFIMDRIVVSADDAITKDEFYDAFMLYCREGKLPTTAKNVVGREISQYVTVKAEHRRVGPRRKHVWAGIRFKRDDEIKSDEEPQRALQIAPGDEDEPPPDEPPDFV